ncbi:MULTISPECIES: hypothetical protein [unclassified Janthinobacterium]|uniref:hypothetical protein n=1 Tax=unclassified Janthinobacterium TaxID=2610881 RepID=UPI001416F093|nr:MULTISPECIES: hypothetical protein [unclassified Janthinobacterium]
MSIVGVKAQHGVRQQVGARGRLFGVREEAVDPAMLLFAAAMGLRGRAQFFS